MPITNRYLTDQLIRLITRRSLNAGCPKCRNHGNKSTNQPLGEPQLEIMS